MILQTGLQRGVRALWEKDMFLDLTLKVQDQAFRVHKVVLASVSDYFCAMFNGSLMESQSEIIELKDLDADRMYNLIEFVYTGEDRLIKYRPGRVLEYAVYFQMPAVIKECTKMMLGMVTVENCIELLSIFTTYALEVGLTRVKTFMKDNLKKVKDHYKAEEMTPEGMQVVLDSWTQGGSEMERFEYIKSWISVDYVKRKEHVDKFMSSVRFSTMSPEDILSIRDMGEYTDGEGAWKDLVNKAFSYHNLPLHHKILEHSEQSKLRWPKGPVIISIGEEEGGSLESYRLCKDKKKRSLWQKYGSQKGTGVTERMPYVLSVNNYLVTCTEFAEYQKWQILDPVGLTWTSIASLPKPREEFALLHHDKYMYVLGGCEAGTKPGERKVTKTIQEYSFETNSWSSKMQLPVAVRNHSACVYKNAIYVSGGVIEDDDGSRMSDRLDRLDLTTNTWESKAPMKKPMANHKMFVMRIIEKNTIVVVDHDAKGHLEIWYYNPKTDVWSTGDIDKEEWFTDHSDGQDFSTEDTTSIRWSPDGDSEMLVRANEVFLLNVHGKVYRERYDPYNPWVEYDEPVKVRIRDICVKWRFPIGKRDDFSEIAEFRMGDLPVRRQNPETKVNYIAGVIALPPPSPEKKKESE